MTVCPTMFVCVRVLDLIIRCDLHEKYVIDLMLIFESYFGAPVALWVNNGLLI